MAEVEHRASAPDAALFYPLRPQLLGGTVTLALYGVGLVVLFLLCRPHAPSVQLWSWTLAVAAFLTIWAGILLSVWKRRPSPQEMIDYWSRWAQFIVHVSNALIVAAIWLFFEYCPQSVRLIMCCMFMACAPCQALASPENVVGIRLGLTATAGSLALWFSLYGTPDERFLAVFVAMMGAGIFVLVSVAPRTIETIAAAHRAATHSARQLEDAVTALAAERDAKTRFIAAASHDLGQPLQAARLFFDQVTRAPDDLTRHRATEGVQRAFTSAEQLLSHMLSHLRLEADRVKPLLARVPLGALLARVAHQHAPTAEEGGMVIRVVPTRRVLLLDPVLLERALGNLIANAILHSGGKRVMIGVRQRSAEKVRIWVLDDGAGISHSDATHIFDDYFQGADSRAKVKSGFGLGLASVRRIANLMGGEAGLGRSWLGGAAFYLEFPDPKLPYRKDPTRTHAIERRAAST